MLERKTESRNGRRNDQMASEPLERAALLQGRLSPVRSATKRGFVNQLDFLFLPTDIGQGTSFVHGQMSMR